MEGTKRENGGQQKERSNYPTRTICSALKTRQLQGH